MNKLYQCMAVCDGYDIHDIMSGESLLDVETRFQNKLKEQDEIYYRLFINEILLDGYDITLESNH